MSSSSDIDGSTTDSDIDGSAIESDLSKDDIEKTKKRKLLFQDVVAAAGYVGMHYYDTYLNKKERRQPLQTGYEWVVEQLGDERDCYSMFRMSRAIFDSLHETLVANYGLKSTRTMISVESLALFLWTVGGPQSVTQVQNRFKRSTETINRKFGEVLECVYLLSEDNIRPTDPEFTTVHPRLLDNRFAPYFNNCIGAIDGTHVPVVVPADEQVAHTGRHGYTSQNVMAVCDFDMRFTFVVAGWPGSAHDTRIFNNTLDKYSNRFPHPPEGN